MPFLDRSEGGRRLGERLRELHLERERPLVMGLPRGGVVVGFEVARALGAPLDVVVARKLGAPEEPELAVGALAEDGECLLNERLIAALDLSEANLGPIVERAREEVVRRVARYRGGRAGAEVAGRTVILVDDGLATGATAAAAARLLRRRGAGRVVLAVPVSSPEAVEAMSAEVDEVVCLDTPLFLRAVGEWYLDFPETSDEEVVRLLAEAEGHAEVDPHSAAMDRSTPTGEQAGR